MAKPHELTRTFAQLPQNMELLEKLWNKQRFEYIRTRLRAIKLLWQGHDRQYVMQTLAISQSSLIRWMKILVEKGVDDGLRYLASPKKAPKLGKLSLEQQAALIDIIENKSPADYGFERHIFTGAILVKVVECEWGITLSDQAIYDFLERNRFSYQRGHRDYEPSDPNEQKDYGEILKKNWTRSRRAKKLSSSTSFGSPIGQPSSTVGPE